MTFPDFWEHLQLKCERMASDDLKIVDGAKAGAWIGPRLGGAFGAVTLQVPTGFEAYARVFHSAHDPGGHPVRWERVANTCGTTAHREMQWHALLGLSSAAELRGSYNSGDGSQVRWAGSDPPIGSMGIDTLDALCSILAAHTADVSHCFFGLCTISGWLDSFPDQQLGPLLKLPHGRDHIILSGPLYAIRQINRDCSRLGSLELDMFADEGSDRSTKTGDLPCSSCDAPNLIWPADQSWFVATEVDYDSTLVGGSTKLIDAITDSPKLEAWQVGPGDSLAEDADKLNLAQQK